MLELARLPSALGLSVLNLSALLYVFSILPACSLPSRVCRPTECVCSISSSFMEEDSVQANARQHYEIHYFLSVLRTYPPFFGRETSCELYLLGFASIFFRWNVLPVASLGCKRPCHSAKIRIYSLYIVLFDLLNNNSFKE